MRETQFWRLSTDIRNSSTRTRVVAGSVVSTVIVTAASVVAYSSFQDQSVTSTYDDLSTSRDVKTKLDVDTSNNKVSSSVTSIEQPQISNHSTNTSTTNQQEHHVTTTIRDENGNRTTERKTYKSNNTDGSSAISIKLNSNSTSSGTSNSTSSVRMNVESDSHMEVTSSE